MLLKHKSRDWWIALALVLALLVSFITYEQNQAILYANIAQRIQALDTGFSGPQSAGVLLANAARIAKGKLLGFSGRPAIERIDIDIKQLEFEKILADRKRALAAGLLTHPQDIKAKIHYRGKRIKAKLRLKGDLPDHWISRYRMSFRISLKGHNYILGFKKFSIHKPGSRQHPYDQVYSELFRQSGGLSAVHNYIHVYVNGEDWGIMDIEEHMSKEFLEKQRAKDSLILKLGSEQRSNLFFGRNRAGQFYPYYRLSDPRLYLKVYDANKYLADDLHRKWLSWIARQRLSPGQTAVYDLDSYSRALLLAFVWNDGHPLQFFNSRHYFNPYLLKLEPIPSDSFIPFPIKQYGIFPRILFDPVLNTSIYPEVFNSNIYQQRLEHNLGIIRKVSRYSDALTAKYQQYFPLDKKIDIAGILESNLQQLTGPAASALRPAARNDQPDSLLFPVHYRNGQIRIYNRAPGPVTVTGLYLDGHAITHRPLSIPAYDPYALKPKVLNTRLTGDMSGRLAVSASYQGRSFRIPFALSATAAQHIVPPGPRRDLALPPLTPEQAAVLPAHLYIRHFKNGRLEVFNLLPEPVNLESIQVKGKQRVQPRITIPGYLPGDYTPIIVETGITGIQDGNLTATSRFMGQRRTTSLGPTLVTRGLENPLLANTPEGLPWLQKIGAKAWRIPAGNWQIDQPVTIQGDLDIQAGTRLNFARQSFLIVKGSLQALGTAEQPIRLQPVKSSWKGLYVLQGGQPSRLHYVHFKDTRALKSGLLSLTGGVSFYAGEVQFDHVVFAGSQAEDALNLVQSKFSLNAVQIHDTASDGIDTDFSNGRIRNSSFAAIGGDALDFSGSLVRINHVDARQVQDKGVSAGELSSIAISNSLIDKAGIGLAAKDGSQIKGSNLTISHYRLKAAMSYVKKGFYAGSPAIHLDHITASDPERAYGRQTGTTLIVDGAAVDAEDIDVQQLYGKGSAAP